MSRWCEVAALVVTAVLLDVLLVVTPAAAAPTAPTAPVEDLRLPVLDLLTGTADAAGLAEVREVPRGADVRLDATLLFAKDRADLRPGARRRLREVAAELRGRGPGRLTITGHTDDLGSAAHGRALSRRRAEAEAAVLRSELPARRYPLTVRGRGEADPVVPNDSEVHRRRNRRVEIAFART